MFVRLWMIVGLSLWVCECQGEAPVSERETPTISKREDTTADVPKNTEKTIEKKSVEGAEHSLNEVAPDLKEVGKIEKGFGEDGSNGLETTGKIDDSKPGENMPAKDPVAQAETAVELIQAENKSCIVSNQTQFSWLVKIVDKETKKHVCTGTLITDEDILIPASCFLDEGNKTNIPETFYDIGKKLMAIAGGGINHNCMQIRNVSVIYPHKGFFESSGSEEHDYAFLKVTPEFDVDDEDIPDLRYHLNVINSEGGLVNIHNNGPFCESPYFLDDELNSVVAEERHLLGMRIDDCMLKWNCSADFDTCLSYLHPAHYACLKPLTPRKCSSRDRGAPLVCDDVFLGYLHLCDGELPMIFRGLNKAIKFLELEEDHIQQPGYMGRRY